MIAHMGHPWMAETIVLIRKHPNLNRFTEGTSLPRIPEEVIEAIIGRDGLALLGLS